MSSHENMMHNRIVLGAQRRMLGVSLVQAPLEKLYIHDNVEFQCVGPIISLCESTWNRFVYTPGPFVWIVFQSSPEM